MAVSYQNSEEVDVESDFEKYGYHLPEFAVCTNCKKHIIYSQSKFARNKDRVYCFCEKCFKEIFK